MKEPREWDDKDIQSLSNPGIGNFGLALFPALYGWQLYGWIAGGLLFLGIATILAALSWAMVFGRIKPSQLTWYKSAVLALAFLALGLSAMEVGRMEGL